MKIPDKQIIKYTVYNFEIVIMDIMYDTLSLSQPVGCIFSYLTGCVRYDISFRAPPAIVTITGGTNTSNPALGILYLCP